ncbi:MAG: spermidine synthase [Polyangiales bacterium]
MKPWETLAEATSSDGERLVLQRRDTEHVLRVGGQVLMSSRARESERALATLATADLRARGVADPRVLLGGLGLGFTLRALLDDLAPAATVTVAELSASIVDWNRTLVAALSGAALDDRRVHVVTGDVSSCYRAERARFDAIVLDVDNGPSALSRRGNRALYDTASLRAAAAALRPDGLYVVWSAGGDDAFADRMRRAGMTVAVHALRSHGARHVLFVGRTVAR